MGLEEFLTAIGQEVNDAEEESFLLFAQDIPSANLGFVDSRATTVDVTIHGQDYSIHQSPTLLSSTRAGGTTGAVLWKITPLLAEWISSSPTNPLWNHSILTPASTVVELGCGISGLVALALAPSINHYMATDQEYVHKLLRENLESNVDTAFKAQARSHRKRDPTIKTGGNEKKHNKKKKQKHAQDDDDASTTNNTIRNITFTSLDWELDAPDMLRDSIRTETGGGGAHGDGGGDGDKGFDLLVSCDCIYNEGLIAPFVRTCAEICRLRPVHDSNDDDGSLVEKKRNPTVCIIAQQQRSPDVFEAWLEETLKEFRVWRVSDEMLGDGLKSGTGYVVHVLLLRGDGQDR